MAPAQDIHQARHQLPAATATGPGRSKSTGSDQVVVRSRAPRRVSPSGYCPPAQGSLMAAVRGVGTRTSRPPVRAPADPGQLSQIRLAAPVNGERARTARPGSTRTRTRSPARGRARTTAGFCEPPPPTYRMRTPSRVRNRTWGAVVAGMQPILQIRAVLHARGALAKSLVIRPACGCGVRPGHTRPRVSATPALEPAAARQPRA